MESHDYFTLRNSSIRRWLLVLGAATCILLVVAPPSLWLCGVGGVLLVLGAAVHVVRAGHWFTWPNRSEEHTSELQSLMRISYAVLCLKKKKQHTIKTNT